MEDQVKELMREDGGQMRRTSEGTRKKLLDAACRVFARYGYQSTPVKRIVYEAGVTKPTLYYYFGDKRELYREVVLDCFNHLCQRLEEIELEGISQHYRANRLIHHFANLATEMPDRLVVLFTAWYAPPRSVDRVRGFDELRFKLVELIRHRLSEELTSADDHPIDPLCAADLVMGTMAQLVWHLLLHETNNCPSDLVRGLASALTGDWNGNQISS